MTVTANVIGTPTSATGSASVLTPAFGASVPAGDYALAILNLKAFSATVDATPAGWTLLATAGTNGSTASGTNTGSTKVAVYGRLCDGTEGGTTVTFNITGADSAGAVIHTFSRSLTGWVAPVVAYGPKVGNSAGMSATSTTQTSVAAGDLFVIGFSINASLGTPTTDTFSQTGVTPGTVTNRSDRAITTGNDTRNRVNTVPVTSVTTPSGGATAGYTNASSTSGEVAFIRLRDANVTSVTSSRATSWHTRAAVTSSRATTWNVASALTSVTSSRATTWRVRAAVTGTRATTWNTRAAVSSTRATTWDVLAAVTSSRGTTWDVLARVTSTRATSWHTRAAVTSSRATTWDTLSRATSSRATTWRVRAAVTSSRATSWNVAGTLASVTSTRSTSWRVRASVTNSRQTTWDTLSRATSSRAASWHTRGAVTASRATSWRTLTAVTAARGTTWRTLERVTASRATSWNVAGDLEDIRIHAARLAPAHADGRLLDPGSGHLVPTHARGRLT